MKDRTFYPEEKVLKLWGSLKSRPTLDITFSFTGETNLQRAIACSCYAGKRYSITARMTDRSAANVTKRKMPLPVDFKQCNRLPKWPNDGNTKEEEEHRLETEAFVKPIWEIADVRRLPPHGVIVVAGETGSRKTTFAREIARLHIDRVMKAGVRPHIVTYEDPIESWFADSPEQASLAGFEYTPRQKNKDVESLDATAVAALRQKPALLYVNEVRSIDDWKSLLFFASTGHLAITTTHAGSLVETFERILTAAEANTAAKRSEIANRVVAVIHSKKYVVKDKDGKLKEQFIPALWLQTARSRTALTQEGLGSLLPSREGEGGCYGRTYFAEKLDENTTPTKLKIVKAALRSDLLGD